MGLFKHLYILSLQESFMDSLPKPEKTAAIFGETPPSHHVQSSHLGKTKSLEQEYHDHALKIQIAYRKRLAHKRFTIKPREFYKQISQEIADKDKRELAQSMFGVTVAGLPTNSPMFRRKAQRYHREGDLTSEAKAIMEKETPGMSQSIDKKFGTYLPISVLHNSPLDEILKKFCNPKDYQIIMLQDSPIQILATTSINSMPAKICQASGVIASPWELAQIIKPPNVIPIIATSASAQTREETPPIIQSPKILAKYHLPDTLSSLQESKIITRLKNNSKREHPTNLLSDCLLKLIQFLTTEGYQLDVDSIQRIALMMDLAGRLYANNYPNFAHCVYVIIHEISLSLSIKHTPSQVMSSRFQGFMTESRQTLDRALGLQDNIGKSNFVAAPANSGTNAYYLASKLASSMMMPAAGMTPKIKVINPYYYEFDYLGKSTTQEDDQADIFILSAGPIVGIDAVDLGVDINLFIKNHIMTLKPPKHRTLIVDATTALYETMALNEEVKSLIREGHLSVIFHESHQKFGLLHTDQAQYGRMFGFLSPDYFDAQQFQKNAQMDFNLHIDMQIGALISQACGPLLEEIKQQHFKNGDLLNRKLFQQWSLEHNIRRSKDSVESSKPYFVPIPTDPRDPIRPLFERLFSTRDSFGHYSSSSTIIGHIFRLSPDASDKVDSMIEAMSICLSEKLSMEELETILLQSVESYKSEGSINRIDQLTLLAIINILYKHQGHPFSETLLQSRKNLLPLVQNCTWLTGRQYYHNALDYISQLSGADYFTQLLAALSQPKVEHPNLETMESYIIKLRSLVPDVSQPFKILYDNHSIKELCNIMHRRGISQSTCNDLLLALFLAYNKNKIEDLFDFFIEINQVHSLLLATELELKNHNRLIPVLTDTTLKLSALQRQSYVLLCRNFAKIDDLHDTIIAKLPSSLTLANQCFNSFNKEEQSRFTHKLAFCSEAILNNFITPEGYQMLSPQMIVDMLNRSDAATTASLLAIIDENDLEKKMHICSVISQQINPPNLKAYRFAVLAINYQGQLSEFGFNCLIEGVDTHRLKEISSELRDILNPQQFISIQKKLLSIDLDEAPDKFAFICQNLSDDRDDRVYFHYMMGLIEHEIKSITIPASLNSRQTKTLCTLLQLLSETSSNVLIMHLFNEKKYAPLYAMIKTLPPEQSKKAAMIAYWLDLRHKSNPSREDWMLKDEDANTGECYNMSIQDSAKALIDKHPQEAGHLCFKLPLETADRRQFLDDLKAKNNIMALDFILQTPGLPNAIKQEIMIFLIGKKDDVDFIEYITRLLESECWVKDKVEVISAIGSRLTQGEIEIINKGQTVIPLIFELLPEDESGKLFETLLKKRLYEIIYEVIINAGSCWEDTDTLAKKTAFLLQSLSPQDIHLLTSSLSNKSVEEKKEFKQSMESLLANRAAKEVSMADNPYSLFHESKKRAESPKAGPGDAEGMEPKH